MATVPTPHTYAVGEVDTAANENSQSSAITFLLGGAAGRKPFFKVVTTVAQTISSGVTTAAKPDSISEDTDSAYSATTGIYTVATAGVWMFTVSSNFASNSAGNRGVSVALNGTQYANSFIPASADPGSVGRCSATLLYRCVVGDQIAEYVYQSSGGNLNLQNPNLFAGIWLGA